ncbi:DUF6541 family protein [Cellulomonas sp. NS3]|uniref:DUF6541 family protein n=1 Tax=Cellulomonas sp. NS3 TaxID=2973977 RepID=UPI0021626AF3|nr:DUF6541 family protein [Cellulomonas sp. NS3]
MEWWGALAVGVLAITVFWLPGLALGRVAGLRGLPLTASAPLLTTGVLAPAAVALAAVGVPWGPASAACVVALAVVCAALVRAWLARRYGRGPVPPVPPGAPGGGAGSRRAWWLVLAVTTGTLGQVVPVALGLGRPGRILTAHDAVAHAVMLRGVRDTGSASSLDVAGAHALDGVSHSFYGAGWHGVAALLGTWPDASSVLNVAFVVPCALAWTLGVAALTQAVFPARPRAWCWAAVASAGGVALPLYLVLRPEGMVANAFGVALVPALLALVTGRPPGGPVLRWGLVVVAGAGLVLVHPNAAASAGLVLTPWFVPRVVGWCRGRRRRTVLVLGSLVLGAVTAAVLARALLAGRTAAIPVLGAEPEAPLPAWEALLLVLGGDATEMGWASGMPVVLAGVLGAVLVRRCREPRWLLVSAALMTAWFLAATSPWPYLTDVDRLWYGEPRRFAPVMAATLLPLAARGIDALPSAWHALRRHRAGSGAATAEAPRALPLAGARRLVPGAVLLLVAGVPAALGLVQLVRFSYTGAGQSVVADDAELAMMHRLGDRLDPRGAVLGSSFSGAAHLYALHGQAVVPRDYATVEDDDLRYVRTHLEDLGADAALCDALDRLGVRYLYVDAHPWNVLPEHLELRTAPARGARLLDSGGTASVYELSAC